MEGAHDPLLPYTGLMNPSSETSSEQAEEPLVEARGQLKAPQSETSLVSTVRTLRQRRECASVHRRSSLATKGGSIAAQQIAGQ